MVCFCAMVGLLLCCDCACWRVLLFGRNDCDCVGFTVRLWLRCDPVKKESERWKKVLLFESCQKESDSWEEELPGRVWLLTESGAFDRKKVTDERKSDWRGRGARKSVTVDRKKVTDERKSDCWEGEVPERVWLLTESSCWQKQCDHWEGELPGTVWLNRKSVTVNRKSFQKASDCYQKECCCWQKECGC